MHRALLSAVLSLSVLLSPLVAAQDASYTFTTIDVPGSTSTAAFGINTAGQIVGQYGDTTGTHGFLKDDATFTTIEFPDARQTHAYGINDSGRIAGHFYDIFGRAHGFVTDGVTYTTLEVPGALTTQAFGINDNGQIVGMFADAAGTHGFVTDGTTFTHIDAPEAEPVGGFTITATYGINASGQIVGSFHNFTGWHNFVTDGVTYTTLEVPGATQSTPWGINDGGQIVGQFSDAAGEGYGYLATMDKTPPLITISTSPATLWPPNGRLVTVAVSGVIMDETDESEVQASTYQVIDEYGQIQPSGTVTPDEVDGSYAFTVQLQASRNGNDRDGRHYTIVVRATDHAGNSGSASATVTVPRK